MKKSLLISFLLFFNFCIKAQVTGDTIVVQAFDYSQNTYGQGDRTKMVSFPSQANLSFEKIIMLYNMRCKGGAVGVQVPPGGSAGCGEWDYSCNTYVVDSTKTDSVKATHPSHIIPGHNGNSFPYTTNPTHSYYQYILKDVIYNNIISESDYTVGLGNSSSEYPFNTSISNAKNQFLWTASELAASGLVAGDITSIRMWVNTVGSSTQLLKIRMKHTTQNALNNENPELTGFTEVYSMNTTMNSGMKQFNFYTPFIWNGTDAILIEFSFSNNSNGSNTSVAADNTGFTSGLVSTHNDFYYIFNGANNFKLNNNNFNTLSNQLSIAFWSYGNGNILPTNTSVIHGHTANGTRQVNVHLPWSNSRIYWDCGPGAGGYDRIDELDANNDFKDKWTYWTFTKNSTSGIMNIYANGSLFKTGNNKTMSIAIDNLVLGAGYNNSVPYFGNMDDFQLWSTELTQAEVQNWMRKKITPAHPQYNQIKANYIFNEGNGNIVYDSASVANNSIYQPLWRIHKGKDIFKNFSETTLRPQVTFVQGVYNQTINNIVFKDSVQNIPYTVYQFATNGISIIPVDTTWKYKAGYTYVYDGDNGNMIDSINNAPAGTINITTLNYYQYSPSRFQIMSFVTPYGNNLNLGTNGKTWTFDVSDFAPILKGNKLMVMDAGGQWQEDMDVKFLFIVGTPPRNIKSIQNIWRTDLVANSNILNNNMFEPRNITLDATAQSFKIRSAITGHGQEGEFIPRTHYINLNGGSPEFSWDAWKVCGENPVFPQGGTWIYDRAGWCPGMATDLVEMNIDPFVSPGATVSIDYDMVQATGDSRYWVSNQLVSYGAANHNLDAAIVDIFNPGSKVEYDRLNPICHEPVIVIRNTGATPLTSATINYWVNNAPTPEVFNWTGNLAFMQTDTVKIPSTLSLWNAITAPTDNIFYVEVLNPNGGNDEYSYNNKMQSVFKVPPVVPSHCVINFKSNNMPAENEYKVVDENGNVQFVRNNMTANTVYNDTLHLPSGCYTFILTDQGGDGISFWANPNAGAGYARIKRGNNGQILKTFNPDFGNSVYYDFTIDFALSISETNAENTLEVYPNPANNIFYLSGKDASKCMVKMYDGVGRVMSISPLKLDSNKIAIDTKHLKAGMYILNIIDKEGRMYSEKIALQHE